MCNLKGHRCHTVKKSELYKKYSKKRSVLALQMEDEIKAMAKENQKIRKGDQPGASTQKSAELSTHTETRKEIAKLAGVS